MHVAVLGAGNMGHGIAHVSAAAGHEVMLRDVEAELVDDGVDAIRNTLAEGVEREKVSREEMEETLDRISGTTDLATAVGDADLVVEAVPEDTDLKRDVMREVEAHASPDAVLASNTSALSVTEIASAVERPNRVLGLHFFNPPHLMDLVEVVVAEQTDDETESFAVSFVRDLGKVDVVVRDSAGFASSRLGLALGLEAMRMVEQGVATPADIDAAMEFGYNHPMGPLELTDHVGLDVRLDIADHLRRELGERFTPPQILRRKVRAGKLGKKTGEGFYVWESGSKVEGSGEEVPR